MHLKLVKQDLLYPAIFRFYRKIVICLLILPLFYLDNYHFSVGKTWYFGHHQNFHFCKSET